MGLTSLLGPACGLLYLGVEYLWWGLPLNWGLECRCGLLYLDVKCLWWCLSLLWGLACGCGLLYLGVECLWWCLSLSWGLACVYGLLYLGVECLWWCLSLSWGLACGCALLCLGVECLWRCLPPSWGQTESSNCPLAGPGGGSGASYLRGTNCVPLRRFAEKRTSAALLCALVLVSAFCEWNTVKTISPCTF